MKKIVIFYSLEGNTRLVAESMAKAIDADLLELKPKQEIKSKGFMKYVWGGKTVMMKSKPDLFPIDKNVDEYDAVFIGTPVWFWTYAPALNTFFAEYSLLNKKIGLFCCHGGGKGRIFNKMKEALKNNQILGEIDFQDPLINNTEISIQKAKEWAENIIAQ